MPSTRAARVEQRAARVAVVDRRVGLDRADDREAGQRVDRAVERRDDADRQRLLLAERAADRRDRRADREVVASSRAAAGAASGPAGSIFSSATSAFGSKPTIFGRDLVVVREADVDLVGLAGSPRPRRCVTTCAFVAISPLPEMHEARAERRAPRCPPPLESPRPVLDDRDDARRVALVDRRGSNARRRRGVAAPRRPRRASWSCWCARRSAAVAAAAAAGADHAAAGERPRRRAASAARLTRAAPA